MFQCSSKYFYLWEALNLPSINTSLISSYHLDFENLQQLHLNGNVCNILILRITYYKYYIQSGLCESSLFDYIYSKIKGINKTTTYSGT